MKRIAALILLSIFALTACGGSEKTAAKQVHQESPTPQVDHEQVWLDTVRSQIPATANASDDTMLNLGHSICSALDSDVSVGDVLQIAMDNGMKPFDSGFLVGASIAAFCPQHKPLLDEFVRENGLDSTYNS